MYDTEEAKETQVDLFYDDERSPLNGRMETVRALRMSYSRPEGDLSRVGCVTHNEVLANRIMGLHRQRLILRGSRDHLSSNPKEPSLLCCCTTLFDGKKHYDHALVVSHPHGQPKKITLGKWRRDVDKEDVFYEEYHATTCPGSSGAPVLHLYSDSQDLSLVLNEPGQGFVHCGKKERSSIFTEEVNYAYENC